MVHVPKTSSPPPFRVTRASHLTYNVRDLSRSRKFSAWW
jgi:catechol 2,3-dioxygenase